MGALRTLRAAAHEQRLFNDQRKRIGRMEDRFSPFWEVYFQTLRNAYQSGERRGEISSVESHADYSKRMENLEYNQLSIDKSMHLPYLDAEEVNSRGKRAAQSDDCEDLERDPELQEITVDYGSRDLGPLSFVPSAPVLLSTWIYRIW